MPKERPGRDDARLEGLEGQLSGLAALDDPIRRALYLHVTAAPDDVSRDEAASVVGVSRSLAGFHLDRLVAEGLLTVIFRRLSGRSGPGAGRPAKLYRRSSRQIEVSLPPRRYELAAQLLAGALDTAEAGRAREALLLGARSRGAEIGVAARGQAGPRATGKRLLGSLMDALAAHGYAPELAEGEVRLRNCPFHALASAHTQLVCGMNLALLEGVVEGLEVAGATPVLLPRPGLCCVCLRLESAGGRSGARSRPRRLG